MMELEYNKPFYQKTGLKITTEPIEKITDPFLSEATRRLQDNVLNADSHDIEELKELIKLYPDFPKLYNFLALAYQSVGDEIQRYETLLATVKKFPDYHFGIISFAEYVLSDRGAKAAEAILGGFEDIRQFKPGHEYYYHAEFQYFHFISGFIAIDLNNEALAKKHLRMLFEYDRNDAATKRLGKYIAIKSHINFFEKSKKDNEKYPTVAWKNPEKYIQTIAEPILHHSEVFALMQWDYDYEPKQQEINTILALPRETLVADLQTLLIDAIQRYDYYISDDSAQQNYCAHPKHVLAFLLELKEVKVLPIVFDLLRAGDEFFEFWFGDYSDNDLNAYFFLCAKEDLGPFLAFAKEPNVHWYQKVQPNMALTQLPIHFPEKRAEVIAYCQSVFEYFLENEHDENLIDAEYLSSFICDIADFRAIELLPILEKINEKGWINPQVMGNWSEIQEEYNAPFDPAGQHFFPENIIEFYDGSYLSKTLPSNRPDRFKLPFEAPKDPFEIFYVELKSKAITEMYSRQNMIEDEDYDEMDDEDDDYEYDDFEEVSKPKAKDKLTKPPMNHAVPKTSQNAPCPCGSGKKYKRCHGKA